MYVTQFIKQLHRFSGKALYVNVLAMVLVSLLEGVGLFILLPLINASGIGSIVPTGFTKYFSMLNHIPIAWTLPLILIVYIVVSIAQTFVQQRLSLRNTKILIRFTNHIRLQLYRDLLQANWSFFAKKRKSDLTNTLTDEFARLVSGTGLLLQLLTTIVFASIQIGIAFWLSAKITIFVLLAGVVLGYFSRWFIKRSRVLGTYTLQTAQEYSRNITDYFNGVKDIKSNVLEYSKYTWLEDWCERIENEQLNASKLKNVSQLFYKSISIVLIAILIYSSVQLFQSQPAQLLLIVLIFSRLWPHFINVQSSLEAIGNTIPVLQSFEELQKECKAAQEIQSIAGVDIRPFVIKERISCRNISFRYEGSENYALKNMTVEIPVNQTIAVTGRSGAGKSTFIDLIMGLMQPESGTICVDGTAISNDQLPSWRKTISYVSQDPFLFNETIRQNLLLVNEKATEEELWEALHFAAADFVEELPHGLDTVVGDRGVRLSGGERQRLVLARAILRNPSILVLDEATSALDSENERKIHDALDRLKGKMTIIVIAHRLSTIRNADQVIVIDKGEVVQQGEFTELSEHKTGLFHHLLTNQIVVEV